MRSLTNATLAKPADMQGAHICEGNVDPIIRLQRRKQLLKSTKLKAAHFGGHKVSFFSLFEAKNIRFPLV